MSSLSAISLPGSLAVFGLEGVTLSDIIEGRGIDFNAVDRWDWRTTLDAQRPPHGVWHIFDLANPNYPIVHNITRPTEGDDNWAHGFISLHLQMSQLRMREDFNVDITVFNYNGTDFFMASATSEHAIRDQVIGKINADLDLQIDSSNVNTFYCYDTSAAIDIAMGTYGNSLAESKDIICFFMRLMRAMDIITAIYGHDDAIELNGFVADVVISKRCLDRAYFSETCGKVRALCGRCQNGNVREEGEKVIESIKNDFDAMTA